MIRLKFQNALASSGTIKEAFKMLWLLSIPASMITVFYSFKLYASC